MEGHPFIAILVQVAGAFIAGFILLDVFLTVLYARIGSGILSHNFACWTWWVFRAVAGRPGNRQDRVLSFCGPVILVLLVTTWFSGLACGLALIVQPRLGTKVTAAGGPTTRNFGTAFYVAGDSMTTVGTSDVAPNTTFFRLFYVFCSFIGMSVITLTVTYFLEIYNALQRRNTFALKVHLMTAETADAAELLAGIGPQGRFNTGYAHLTEMAAEMITLKESHHFYSVLLYFRFRESFYALSRVALVTLDLVSLIKSALDDEQYGWLKQSAAVEQLWRGTMRMLTILAVTFLPGGLPDVPPDPPDTLDRWRRRYADAVSRLRQAQIATLPDEQLGAEIYIALRLKWDRYIAAFASHMGHDLAVIDLATTDPTAAESRQPFSTRLRAAG